MNNQQKHYLLAMLILSASACMPRYQVHREQKDVLTVNRREVEVKFHYSINEIPSPCTARLRIYGVNFDLCQKEKDISIYLDAADVATFVVEPIDTTVDKVIVLNPTTPISFRCENRVCGLYLGDELSLDARIQLKLDSFLADELLKNGLKQTEVDAWLTAKVCSDNEDCIYPSTGTIINYKKSNKTPSDWINYQTQQKNALNSLSQKPPENIETSFLEAGEVFPEFKPALFDNDVFTYFDLENYDTPLKISVFKKTAEYKDYLKKLSEEREKFLGKSYYIQIPCSDVYGNGLSRYNMKRRGMVCDIVDMGEPNAPPPYAYSGLILKGLPVKLIYRYTNTDPSMMELYGQRFEKSLFLPMNENKGLEIENTKDAQLYLACKKLVVSSYMVKECNFTLSQVLNPQGGVSCPLKPQKGPACDSPRVFIVDDESKKILYERNFSKL